jgi:ribosomal protein S18 acetylase RimI-like enzyme
MLTIRAAITDDSNSIWRIMEPIIRAGDTYAVSQEMNRQGALDYWWSSQHEVYVAEDGGDVVGTYYLCANQGGGGSHVANCGYMTATSASGKGVARAMCAHSLAHAKNRDFRAMQFNFVVSTNERAVRLWQSFQFEVVGQLPGAFLHPSMGYVDVYVMYRML